MLFAFAGPSFALNIYVGPDGKFREKVLNVPYAFYNENFGATAAYAYGGTGFPQKHSLLLSSVMVGSKGSGMVALLAKDLRARYVERLFVDPIVQLGYFRDLKAFIDGNPDFPDERSGSNDSDKDDFIEGDGFDNFFRIRFKYLLPIGAGKDTIIRTVMLDGGLLAPVALEPVSWNPLKTGRAFLDVLPFYRSQSLDSDNGDQDLKTNGLEFSFFLDNVDLRLNPSEGYAFKGKVSRDFGLFDSSDAWTTYSSELDIYFSLATNEIMRQQVIALDFWTVNAATWDIDDQGEISNAPPPYAGASLGGVWRMRAFPTQRFNDKAAIYYSAEYRMIPHWNPFDSWPWLQHYLEVAWIQFVPFVEVGRVAPEWSLSELHDDMKWDAGFGFRAMAKGLVVRIDTAFSEEGANVQMMVGHPFQF